MSVDVFALEARLRDLEAKIEAADRIDVRLARLATFPEQNPNLVVETTLAGEVTYVNPVAAERFPSIGAEGPDHPLLAGLREVAAALTEGNAEFVAREVDLGDAVFEQKICVTKTGNPSMAEEGPS